MKDYKTPEIGIRFMPMEDVLTASDGIIRDTTGWNFGTPTAEEEFYD